LSKIKANKQFKIHHDIPTREREKREINKERYIYIYRERERESEKERGNCNQVNSSELWRGEKKSVDVITSEKRWHTFHSFFRWINYGIS